MHAFSRFCYTMHTRHKALDNSLRRDLKVAVLVFSDKLTVNYVELATRGSIIPHNSVIARLINESPIIYRTECSIPCSQNPTADH